MQDDQQNMQKQTDNSEGQEEGRGGSKQDQNKETSNRKYIVKVIREKCIGAASCVAVAPNTFKMDEDNIAIVLGQKLDSDEDVLLAAQSCPTAAVVVIDDETGEQVWPK